MSTANRGHAPCRLLDDDTPALPDLIALVAAHYRVKAPRARVVTPG